MEVIEVPILRALYNDALRAVNQTRKIMGIVGDVTELPAGVGYDGKSCPCAKHCVSKTHYAVFERSGIYVVPIGGPSHRPVYSGDLPVGERIDVEPPVGFFNSFDTKWSELVDDLHQEVKPVHCD